MQPVPRSRTGESVAAAGSLRENTFSALSEGMEGGAMPVYQYKCKACGKVFEITCHLSERDELAVCPDCGGKDVTPVFSTFGSPPPPKY